MGENWKSTIMGVLQIVVAIGAAVKEFLATTPSDASIYALIVGLLMSGLKGLYQKDGKIGG